jgi:hypothetical protein
MTGMDRLRVAVNVLSELDQFKDTTFIAELPWSSIPEAYSFRYSIITNGNKVSVYRLESTTIAEVTGIGIFQTT